MLFQLFRRSTRRLLLVGLAAVASCATVAPAATIADAANRFGRWAGCGYGDGYHKCESRAYCPAEDLPLVEPPGMPADGIAARWAHSHRGPACGPILSVSSQATAVCDGASCDSGLSRTLSATGGVPTPELAMPTIAAASETPSILIPARTTPPPPSTGLSTRPILSPPESEANSPRLIARARPRIIRPVDADRVVRRLPATGR